MYDSFARLCADEKEQNLALWELIRAEDCAENGEEPSDSWL